MKKNISPAISDSILIRTVEFDRYELYIDEDFPFALPSLRYYIIGYNEKKRFSEKNGQDFQDKYVLPEKNGRPDFRVLHSLISIASKFVHYSPDDKIITYKAIAKDTIRWCQKFGLPFMDAAPQGLINDTWERNFYLRSGYIGFSLDTFMSRLHRIYDVFMKATSELFDEDIFSFEFGTEKKNPYHTRCWSMPKEDKYTHIENLLEEAKLWTVFNFVDGKMQIQFETDDYLSLAIYQMALYIANPRCKAIRSCQCCNALFLVENLNKLYCDDCSPQKLRAREQNKKKEAAKNV